MKLITSDKRLVLMLLCLCAVGAIAAPYRFQGLREGDRASYVADKFVVYSKTGIGQVTIAPDDQEWPVRVTLRFCYLDGTGMARIEGLGISTQTLALRGSFRNDKQMPFSFTGAGPEQVAGSLDIDFHLVDGALELTLPDNFARHAEFLTVSWVDAYR